MKITAISLELGQARLFLNPISLKIIEKREREERKGARAKQKRLATVFSYYGVPLEIVFERPKNTMPSTLTDSY